MWIQSESNAVRLLLVGSLFFDICVRKTLIMLFLQIIKMKGTKEEVVEWLRAVMEELLEGFSNPLEVCVVRVFICPCVWNEK